MPKRAKNTKKVKKQTGKKEEEYRGGLSCCGTLRVNGMVNSTPKWKRDEQW